MSKQFRRLMSLIRTLILTLGLAQNIASAAGQKPSGEASAARVYTEADNALLENDVFAKISAVTADSAQPMGGVSKMTEANYIAMLPEVIDAIKGSKTYVAGSLQQNGNFLVWETTTGIPCCYDPRMEAKLHNADNAPSEEAVMAAEAGAKAFAAQLRQVLADSPNGGSPSSVEIGLIQPYWESNSSYADSSFRSYSPYYKSMWQELYAATGGSSNYRYSMTNATVDNVAKAIQNCGLVIMDSHGTTDYSGSNGDYTSRANSSYLCLTSNSGITSADTAAKSGTYGTYYDCLKGSGYAYVNGNCIANHMTANAPHSLVYMGICLGMATDKMFTGLRNKGVEVVYGYSQSVSFAGEKIYMQAIMGYLKNGDNFATALSKAKSANGSWDPAYSSYSLSQAKANKVAFPIAVSSEDAYPGQGKVDAVQTVYSTWQLFGAPASYTVSATSNNSNYGTVSVSGNIITASPKNGYYASGYKVTSGSATVTQNGNLFTVNPSSDCTVQIIFAAKAQYTVRFMANGSQYSSSTVYSGDSLAMPSSAPAVADWSFIGWASSAVEETSSKPSYYTPGASFTPSANASFYALYTRSEGGNGETVYQLLTAAPSDWSGRYVITYGNGSSLYAMKGLSGNTKYESASSGGAVALSSTGMSLSGSQLSGAGNAYIFKIASYNGKYSIQNASTGTYLASKSSYLYSNTSLSSSYCAWSLAMSGSAVTASNSASSRYPYLSFSSSKYFMINSSASGSIYFWKEAQAGVSYYSTSPYASVPDPHTHSYGAWVSNNNGTHSRSCSCGESETANCSYSNVVTPPTATQQGYTTHTCTVCGYSYVDSYTPAIGYTYTVSFSVPNGVAAVASLSCSSGSSITLPAAGAPSGYTFLGWVTSDVNNSQSRPSGIVSGSYAPSGNITLKALYSYSSENGAAAYELVTSAPSDWSGNYVITYGSTASGMYVLKGLSGSKKYESASSGGAVALSSTGMTLSGSRLTGASNAYIFTIAKSNSKYSIQNASTGTYLASKSNYLYSNQSFSSSSCSWSFSMNGSAVKAANSASNRYPYLSFSSSRYFMINSSASASIFFWKETSAGATIYTTILN